MPKKKTDTDNKEVKPGKVASSPNLNEAQKSHLERMQKAEE